MAHEEKKTTADMFADMIRKFGNPEYLPNLTQEFIDRELMPTWLCIIRTIKVCARVR